MVKWDGDGMGMTRDNEEVIEASLQLTWNLGIFIWDYFQFSKEESLFTN